MASKGRGYTNWDSASGQPSSFGRGAGRGRPDAFQMTGYLSDQASVGRGNAAEMTFHNSSRQFVVPGRGFGTRRDVQESSRSVGHHNWGAAENAAPFVPPPEKYRADNVQNTNADAPEAELDPWDWPIAKRAEPQQPGTDSGPTAGFNSYTDDLGTALGKVGFNSNGPPPLSTGRVDDASSGGFGSQSGFGGGFGGGFGFNSAQGGFNQESTIGSFGDGTKTRTKKPRHGLGLVEPDQLKELPPIIKDFYVEEPEIATMSDEEVAALRLALNNITVSDVNGSRKPPKPVKSFAQAFRSYPEILEQIEKQGFKEPTPIQCQMWPIALSGYDVIGIAQTGTGKTLGFLMPILIHLHSQPGPRNGPGSVVLTPTRELAKQIHSEVKKYHYQGIKSVCVYGGSNRQHQVQACQEGVDIIIATPGRLRDLMDDDVVDLSTVTFAVLDEADRMLDMGFEPEIRSILYDIRSDRQTVLTSATWPPAVRGMANQYTKDPFAIFVGNMDLSATHTVTQQVFVMNDEDKKETLLEFLNKMKPNEKVIVFVGKKTTAEYLAADLTSEGLKCQRIHGDRDQVDREKALSDLKKGHVRILVGTDVVSRGLDIADITHVFNYDFPQSIEEYVHRIGRTGRAGKEGVSISLLTRGDWHNSTKLVNILAEANQEVPEDLLRMSERFEAKKLELGADAVEPRFRRRREDRGGDRGERNKTYFTDPYTGERL